jgi:hypothetical protein
MRVRVVTLAAAAGVVAAAVTGCSAQRDAECARAVDEAATALIGLIERMDNIGSTQQQPEPDMSSAARMRMACEHDFPSAYSDLIVRIKDGYAPRNVFSGFTQKMFISALCIRSDDLGVPTDELTDAARQVCQLA